MAMNLTPSGRALYRVWEYLWKSYYDNGGVIKPISDAITLIQERYIV
jgi:hypothetical protein